MKYYIIGLTSLVLMLGFATVKLHIANTKAKEMIVQLQAQTVSGMISTIKEKHKMNDIKITAIENKKSDLDVQKVVIGSEQEQLERMSNGLQDLQTTYNDTLASSSQ